MFFLLFFYALQLFLVRRIDRQPLHHSLKAPVTWSIFSMSWCRHEIDEKTRGAKWYMITGFLDRFTTYRQPARGLQQHRKSLNISSSRDIRFGRYSFQSLHVPWQCVQNIRGIRQTGFYDISVLVVFLTYCLYSDGLWLGDLGCPQIACRIVYVCQGFMCFPVISNKLWISTHNINLLPWVSLIHQHIE